MRKKRRRRRRGRGRGGSGKRRIKIYCQHIFKYHNVSPCSTIIC
jgi:hypothetical protein